MGLGVGIVAYRVFPVNIDLLLSARGGGYKAVQTRQVEQKTHQAHAAGPDFDAHQLEANHEAV